MLTTDSLSILLPSQSKRLPRIFRHLDNNQFERFHQPPEPLQFAHLSCFVAVSTFPFQMILWVIAVVPIVLCLPNNDLYILIDEVSVYNCRGGSISNCSSKQSLVKNEIKISEEDIDIVNEKGNKVYYIHAPGNYSLHFKSINVEKKFGHLGGEIGVTLQVPIIEGSAGSLDLHGFAKRK